MIPYLIASGITLMILIVTATLYLVRTRHTRAWMRRIMRAETDQQIIEVGPMGTRYYDAGWGKTLRKAHKTAALQKYEAATFRQAVRESRAKFNTLDTPYDRALMLMTADYNDHLEHELFGMSEVEVGERYQQDIDTTLALVATGDLVAMNGFVQIMDYGTTKFCNRYGIPTLSYPADWNNLVAKYYTDPVAGDFKNTPDLTVGTVRMMAAKALRTGDYNLAKIVLAYCKSEREVLGDYNYSNYGSGRSRQVVWPYLVQVTEELAAQLIVMVEGMDGTSHYSQSIQLRKHSAE